jgi:Flp pilus assembly protein TadB
MFRYLPGILLVQVATVALVLAAMKTDEPQLWYAMGFLALIVNLVTALWFGSIASHRTKDALSRVQAQFSAEREKLKVGAEQQRSRLLKQTHDQITRATNRAHARANFKVGAAFTGIVAAGVLMMFTQFMTLGVLTLASGGGALAGYLVRARQSLASRRRNDLLVEPAPPAAGANPPPLIKLRPDKTKRLPR